VTNGLRRRDKFGLSVLSGRVGNGPDPWRITRKIHFSGGSVTLGMALALATSTIPSAQAQTLTVLHRFTGTDGPVRKKPCWTAPGTCSGAPISAARSLTGLFPNWMHPATRPAAQL
jgi:hypothetical protein